MCLFSCLHLYLHFCTCALHTYICVSTVVQAITVWLTAEEGSDVFERGRHILSPTKAHDERAVQERDTL